MQVSSRSDVAAETGSAIRAFLIADIRGYSTFTRERGHDEAAKLAATFVDLAGDTVEANGGRIVEIRGDEVLAVFESALRAVRAGLDLQLACVEESAEQANLTVPAGVGIDVGQSVREGVHYHSTHLNLAARLCSKALAGEVLVTRAVAAECAEATDIQLDERGTAEFKGFDASIDVLAATTRHATAAPSVIRLESMGLPAGLDPVTPMVGRDREFHWLRGIWRQARRGRGRVAFLSGLAQIGKTRLASELADQVVQKGGMVAYAGPGGTAAADALSALRGVLEPTEPTLVVLDSLDATGDAPLEALRESLDAISTQPVFVLCLVQDPDRTPAVAELVWCAEAEWNGHRRLAPLGLSEVREIARLYAGEDVAEVPVESILRASDGVPGRVHEVMSEWARGQATRRLSAAAEYLAAGRSRRSADLEFANNVIGLKLGRIYSVGEAGHLDGAGLCPFKGLASFEESDAELFFGRERLVGELAARTVGTSLLGVVGDSGSGKSSVVAAGLLPSLRAGLLPGSERWASATIRPGEHPLASLRNALGDRTIAEGLGSVGEEERLVLFVDQFEETFTNCADEEERQAFVDELTAGATSPDRFVAIVAVRGDFYGHCARYPEFAQLLAENHVPIGAMSDEELRRAIELPARRAGLRVESALVDALVEEVADEPGGLPLLSTTLVELWQRREGPWLRLRAYEEVGGLRGSVARLAEGTYEQLSEPEHEAARGIFLRLVGPGEGDAVTRRRALLSEFDLDRDAVTASVLDRLTRDRLLTVSETTVEVAHEALLREWPRLRGWIEEDAQGQQLRVHLTQSARQWDASGRESSELYRGARLSATLDWSTVHPRELNELERDFVSESRQASERDAQRLRRTNRRLRGLVAGVALFLVVALIAGALALVQRGQARTSAANARHQATVALSQSVGAQGVSDTQLDTALLLATQGVRLNDSIRTRGDLETALAREQSAVGVFRLEPPGTLPGNIAVSPDGRTLAVITSASDLRFYDTVTKRPVGPPITNIGSGFFGSQFFGSWAAYSPDGSKLYVEEAKNGTPEIVDVATHRVLRTLKNGGGVLSPDGTMTYQQSEAQDGLTRVDLITGKRLPDIPVPGFHATAAVAARTGEVLTLSESNALVPRTSRNVVPQTIQVRQGKTGTLERSFRVLLPPDEGALAISPDGRLGVYATAQACISCGQNPAVTQEVRFIDLRTGRVQIGNSDEGGFNVAFSPDGSTVAVDDGDTVRLWDPTTATVSQSLAGHTGQINSLAFDAAGRTLYTSSTDGTVIAYDLTGTRGFAHVVTVGSGNLVHITIPAGQLHGYANFSASPSGRIIATTQTGGVVNLVDVTSGRVVTSFHAAATGNADATAFSPDGRELVVASDPGDVSLWRLNRGQPTLVRRFRGMLGGTVQQQPCGAWLPFPWATFSPDGQWIAGGDSLAVHPKTCDLEAARIVVWDAATGAERAAPANLHAMIGNLSFSNDGKLIATPTDDPNRNVVVVDARTLKVVHAFQADPYGVDWVAFSPDADVLATAGGGGDIELWDTRTWKKLGQVQAFGDGVLTVAFDPTGRELVATDAKSVVSMWTVPRLRGVGTALSAPFAQHIAIYSPATALFADNGRAVLVVQEDGEAAVWPATAEAWEAEACSVANRNMTRPEWAALIGNRPYQKTCPGLP